MQFKHIAVGSEQDRKLVIVGITANKIPPTRENAVYYMDQPEKNAKDWTGKWKLLGKNGIIKFDKLAVGPNQDIGLKFLELM